VLRPEVATESAPKEFPHYVDGYYAAFFYDPDGIKLEVAYEPTRTAIASQTRMSLLPAAETDVPHRVPVLVFEVRIAACASGHAGSISDRDSIRVLHG
jgi:hypothetical protein